MDVKRMNHAQYMSMQLMEIESLRVTISQKNSKIISFNEAAMLWVSKGHADNFKAANFMHGNHLEPACA